MITSTTLLLATLVFNAATVLGAPIRIPTQPDVVVRAVVDDPVLLSRADVVDVQPVRKRSVEGTANRPRLAREIAPEVDTRDTASGESVSVRDSPPEVEEELARRFPRRGLYERYIAKRSPEPAPSPPSDPSVKARSTAPEPVRRFARRALHDRHAERSEPVPEARSEGSPDPDPHFVRRENPELFQKRSAPSDTDNFPREPEPAPAPEPAPEPAPVPIPVPEPDVKPREPERTRAFPRRALAERYGNIKRQEATEEPPVEPETPAPAAPEPTPSATSTTSATTTPPVGTPTPTAPGLPVNLDFNKVIADAIVSGTTTTNKHSQGHKIADYKDTKITIQITQQQNSDVKLEPIANPSASPSSPPSPDATTSTGTPTPTGTSTPTDTSTPSGTPTPTGTGAPTPPEGSGATTTGAPPAAETKPASEDPEAKPEGESGQGGDAANAESLSGSKPAGEPAAEPAEAKRDLDNANAAAEPVTKRHLGLAGSLLASWTRRNVQN